MTQPASPAAAPTARTSPLCMPPQALHSPHGSSSWLRIFQRARLLPVSLSQGRKTHLSLGWDPGQPHPAAGSVSHLLPNSVHGVLWARDSTPRLHFAEQIWLQARPPPLSPPPGLLQSPTQSACLGRRAPALKCSRDGQNDSDRAPRLLEASTGLSIPL